VCVCVCVCVCVRVCVCVSFLPGFTTECTGYYGRGGVKPSNLDLVKCRRARGEGFEQNLV